MEAEPESSKQYTFDQFVQNITEDVDNKGALPGNKMPLSKNLNTNLSDLPKDEKPPKDQMQNGDMPMQGQLIHGLKSFVIKRSNALTNQLAKGPPQ